MTKEYLKHLYKLRKDKKYRDEQKKVLIVGKKMVEELRSKPEKLILTKNAEPPSHLKGVAVLRIKDDTMQKLTGLKNPDGICAEMAMPQSQTFNGLKHVIALDGIQDPGNLGTLIRTALSFNWDGVYIIDPSCDPYNDKALRAAKGATFRIPIQVGPWSELRELIRKNSWTPYAADMNGRPVDKAIKADKILLLFGSEGQGISHDAKLISTPVSIPMHQEMESLNVAIAGGILMYLLKKQ